MSEETKTYSPEEVARKVLEKCQEIYNNNVLAKAEANSSHVIEAGEEPNNDDAECPESLAYSGENPEASKRDKPKKDDSSLEHEEEMDEEEEIAHDAAENRDDEKDEDIIEADEEADELADEEDGELADEEESEEESEEEEEKKKKKFEKSESKLGKFLAKKEEKRLGKTRPLAKSDVAKGDVLPFKGVKKPSKKVSTGNTGSFSNYEDYKRMANRTVEAAEEGLFTGDPKAFDKQPKKVKAKKLKDHIEKNKEKDKIDKAQLTSEENKPSLPAEQRPESSSKAPKQNIVGTKIKATDKQGY